jgi:hypothetical protein
MSDSPGLMMNSRNLLASALFLAGSVVACSEDTSSLEQEVNANAHDHANGNAAFKQCGTRNQSDAERTKAEQEVAARAPSGPTVPGGVIDVYFHVILDTDGDGAVTNQQISRQITVLNDAYAPWGYSFNLVEITRTTNAAWYNLAQGSTAEKQMKSTLRRGTADDLNLYSNAGDVYLGWATFPDGYRRNPSYDGVVLFDQTLPGGNADYPDTDGNGEPDGSYTYNLGDTATHEVGHWLGLYHTFQGGCNGKGDSVSDTPAERAPAFECIQVDTCSGEGVDPIHNFMDYGDDPCLDRFTVGQDARMDSFFSTYRYNK